MSVSLSDIERRELQSDCKKENKKKKKRTTRQKLLRTGVGKEKTYLCINFSIVELVIDTYLYRHVCRQSSRSINNAESPPFKRCS